MEADNSKEGPPGEDEDAHAHGVPKKDTSPGDASSSDTQSSTRTSEETYEKITGSADTKGVKYEYKMAAWLFLRLKNNKTIDKFRLVSNVKWAGALDDIVVTYSKIQDPLVTHSCFIQLKHVLNKPLTAGDFTDEKGRFFLPKHLKDYLKIKETMSEKEPPVIFSGGIENFSCVLYTNALPDEHLQECLKNGVLLQLVETKEDKSNKTQKGKSNKNKEGKSSKTEEGKSNKTKEGNSNKNTEDKSNKTKEGKIITKVPTGILLNKCQPRELFKFEKSEPIEELIFSFSKDKNSKISFLDNVTAEFNDKNNDKKTVTATPGDITVFFQSLTVYSGQSNESQFDEMIVDELIIAFQNRTSNELKFMYPFYLGKFEDWYSSSNIILNKCSKILKIAFDDYILKCSLSKEDKFCLKSSAEKYLGFLDANVLTTDSLDTALLHIVPSKFCEKLCCTKLIQSMQNEKIRYMFLSLDSLLKTPDAVIAAWGDNMTQTLVIISESNEGYEEKKVEEKKDNLIATLCNHLEKCKRDGRWRKKIIVVSAEDDKFFLKLKLKLPDVEYKTIHDTFQLSLLDSDSRKTIQERSVRFQGVTIKLGNLLTDGDYSMPGVLNDDFILKVLKVKDIVSLGTELEETIPYYVPRSLERWEILKENALKDKNQSDVFIVHNISEQDLKKLVPDGEEVGQVENYSKHKRSYMVLGSGSDDDVAKVCEGNKNVHELEMSHDGKLRWLKSKGNINNIKDIIDSAIPNKTGQTRVQEFESRVVLIEGKPGIGKSTFVTRIANQTKEDDPTLWVIRVNLAQHMDLLKSPNENGAAFLERASGIDKLSTTEKELFQHSIVTKGNVVVFLDGFDEIAPKYTGNCLSLISTLLNTKVQKIIITTRHSMRHKLESHLSTLAFTLFPFTKENHKEFFWKFWNKEVNTFTEDQKKYIDTLIDKLQDSMNDKEKQFLGIPLHAWMIAEIYGSKPDKSSLTDKIGLQSLFEKVINKKLSIYFEREYPGNDNIDYDELSKNILKDYMHAALVLLLDNSQLQSLGNAEISKNNKLFAGKIKEGKNKTGIVDAFTSDLKAIFVHRVFAEYFAALWFFLLYKNEGNFDFLRKYLYTDNFQIVRKFFDLMLVKESNFLMEEQSTSLTGEQSKFLIAIINNIKSDESVDVQCKDLGGRSALHLASAVGFDCGTIPPGGNPWERAQLVSRLLEGKADVDMKDKLFEWTAIEYATHTHSWDALEILLENCSPEAIYTIKKNKELIETITNEKLMYNKGVKCKCTLVHQAAAYGQANIIKHILKNSIKLFDGENCTPLHAACRWGQIRVVKTLLQHLETDLEKAEYINTKDYTGICALHWASRIGDSKLVSLLILKGGNIRACDALGRTPLFDACRSGKIEAAQVLIAHLGTDSDKIAEHINTPDNEGNYALHEASRLGDFELVSLLILNGVNIWARDKDGRTPLFDACRAGKLETARVLIEHLGTDSEKVAEYIDTPDNEGNYALHEASRLGDFELVSLLIWKGGNSWARNKDGRTPLFNACREGKIKVARLLINNLETDSKAEYINTPDYEGNYAIHDASYGRNSEILSLLISNGGNIWAQDGVGRTPLFVAFRHYGLEAARVLIKHLGSDLEKVAKYIDTPDSEGKSALHRASFREFPKLVSWLISNGGNISARDKEGRTPLFYACREGKIKVARVLIEHMETDSEKAEYINTLDSEGESALSLVRNQVDRRDILALLRGFLRSDGEI